MEKKFKDEKQELKNMISSYTSTTRFGMQQMLVCQMVYQ